jgi:hypothetical protein
MNLLNQVQRMEGVGFAGSWRAAALINTRSCSTFAQNYGAARQSILILGVPYPNSLYIDNRIRVSHSFFGITSEMQLNYKMKYKTELWIDKEDILSIICVLSKPR